MTYAQFGTVQAADFNSLVGGNPTTTANTLNAVWATGGGSAGYGQTPVGNVTVGTSVAASDWASLINKTSNSATHQGSSISSVTAPSSGNTISYLSAVPTNLQTIYTNKLNAATQGSTTFFTLTTGTSWTQYLLFTHTATFANGDAARYFFNSGGQIKMTASHPNGSGINALFYDLAGSTSGIGTVVMSAPTSGSATIVGTSYAGIKKVSGGGNAPTIDATKGYFGLTTSNANVFTQTAAAGPSSYLSSFIRYIAKSNGTQGANGDAGSVITIYSLWDEVPDGATVSSGSTSTMTIAYPESTNLANTWGTVTLSGSYVGV